MDPLLIFIGLAVLLIIYRVTKTRDVPPIEPGQLVRVIQYQTTLGPWPRWAGLDLRNDS
jgi:hypothetical protein